MKAREFKFRRLDVAAFAEEAGELSGEIPLPELERLSTDQHADASSQATAPVRWSARGEARARRAASPEVWLHLQADAEVTLECQRCLQPLAQPLHIDRWFRFAATEAEAADLDEDSDDDVLVLSRAFDLQELIEDELLLELPVVPRHDACPQPLTFSAATDDFDTAAPDGDGADTPAERPNPFAALAALKRSGDDGNSGPGH